MSICLCYHNEQNFLHEHGVCYGTKEKEPCSCGGNPVKCDFYEEVREKYIHQTNYDNLHAKSVEEMAEFLETLCPSYNWTLTLKGMTWLDWLEQEEK